MTANNKKIALTGAFSYTGKYIARDLLSQGYEVMTLTGNTDRENLFGDRVAVHPFNFDNPDALAASLEGVDTLINTYWVRYNVGENTYHRAIANTRALFRAAKQAGVRRVVHVSIANPHRHSPLPYYWGKALLEEDLQASGMSYAILRPTVIFGQEDILINNIAWFLRHLPVFGIPGDGEYRLQPIFVEDMAALAVKAAQSDENQIIDAIGPETFTFTELVNTLKGIVGSRAVVIKLPARLGFATTWLVGKLVGDVILTWEEFLGLMDDLLATDSPPAGNTKLTEWAKQNAHTLGAKYANEVKRHFIAVGNN